MPDKRHDELFDDSAYVFLADFKERSEDTILPIWASSAFASKDIAEKFVKMITCPVGRLPALMRKKLDHIVLLKGDVSAFAESEGHFFTIYSENMVTRLDNHDLEETVFHESVHATLDSEHLNNTEWQRAQRRDDAFITAYGKATPTEDLAESALFVYALLKHPGRLPQAVESWIRKNIPHRVEYIRNVFSL